MSVLTLNLTKINTFWRQIARLRARAYTRNAGDNDNIHAGTSRGNLSYTAEEEARETEPTQSGNKYIVCWIYWKHEAGTRVATPVEVKSIRDKCRGYSGMTVNGDELLVCSEEVKEELKKSELMNYICGYDLKYFE